MPSVPMSLIRAKISSACRSISSVSASTYQEPPSGSATLIDPGLLHDHLLGAQRDLGRLGAGQRQHLVERVGVQRVGAAEHRGQRLDRRPDDVVVRLLRGQRDAGGLGVEAQPLRLLGRRAVDVAQPAGPDPAGGAELRDLLEEVQVRVEEEATARGRTARRPARGTAPAPRRRTRRPACTPAPARRSSRPRGCGSRTPRSACSAGISAAQYSIRSPIRRRCGSGANSHSFCAMYSLKMSVCSVPLSVAEVDALPLGGDQVHAEHRHGGAADRHRRWSSPSGMPSKSTSMSAAESIATPQCPTSPSAARVVGVAAHQRRHVEGDRQPAAALGQDHLVALVGLLGVAEAGELPDGPGPAAVAGGVQPAGERELPGPADPLEARARRPPRRRRPVDRLDRPPESVVKSASRLRARVVPLLPALRPSAIVAGRPSGVALPPRAPEDPSTRERTAPWRREVSRLARRARRHDPSGQRRCACGPAVGPGGLSYVPSPTSESTAVTSARQVLDRPITLSGTFSVTSTPRSRTRCDERPRPGGQTSAGPRRPRSALAGARRAREPALRTEARTRATSPPRS